MVETIRAYAGYRHLKKNTTIKINDNKKDNYKMIIKKTNPNPNHTTIKW